METMTGAELKVLHSYINKATHYLEFGSGSSTIYAAGRKNLKFIDSVESSKDYINESLKPHLNIKNALLNGRLTFHKVDLGENIKSGCPKDNQIEEAWVNYSSRVFKRKSKHDLVFINGKFKVACALNCILHTPDDCIIIVHDFWNKEECQLLLEYLEVKERVDTLAVFTKKAQVDLQKLKLLIQEYQFCSDDRPVSPNIRSRFTRLFLKK